MVDCAEGREVGTTVYPYRHGVIDERLPAPEDDVELEPDWALQDPEDYLRTLREVVPALLAETGVDPAEVIGVGIDFTACTMLPTLADGTPLCLLEELRSRPHAWVKLWKHHAAQPEADRINEVAAELDEVWLPRYGGKISSEWFFAKALQILDEAPEIYARADRLIEAADWIVWQLTGTETRNTCTAGYKAIWSKRDGFPGDAYFAALDPRFEHVVDEKMSRTVSPIGSRAGGLSEQSATWLRRVQNDLFDVGADLAVPPGRDEERPRLRVGGEYVTWLEEACDAVRPTFCNNTRSNVFTLTRASASSSASTGCMRGS